MDVKEELERIAGKENVVDDLNVLVCEVEVAKRGERPS